jgi:hypothetical protein
MGVTGQGLDAAVEEGPVRFTIKLDSPNGPVPSGPRLVAPDRPDG